MSKYLVPLALAVALSGCRQDMQQQPKYRPAGRNWFFPDGRDNRAIPAGTFVFGDTHDDAALTTGSTNEQFVTTIPIPVTAELLARGQDRFNIYCSPCHGRTGDGNGMIALRGVKYPANLNSDDIRNAPPGYLYAVIVNGFGAMADYGYQIASVRDRWAVVAYIRALELSRRAPLDVVPPAERRKLEEAR